jgi:hypothetical protein
LIVLAWGMRAITRRWAEHLVLAVERRFPNWRLAAVLRFARARAAAYKTLENNFCCGTSWCS